MTTPNNTDNVSLMRQVRLSVDSLNTNLTTAKPHLSYQATDISADSYVLWIDLDNSAGTGPWPHTKTRSVDIDHLSIHTQFQSGSAEMIARFGVLTAISASDSSVHYHINARMGTNSQYETQSYISNYQPSSVHFETDSAGNSIGALTNIIVSESAITSTTLLDSPAGLSRPSVGDVIMKLDYVGDTFDINVDCIYHTK